MSAKGERRPERGRACARARHPNICTTPAGIWRAAETVRPACFAARPSTRNRARHPGIRESGPRWPEPFEYSRRWRPRRGRCPTAARTSPGGATSAYAFRRETSPSPPTPRAGGRTLQDALQRARRRRARARSRVWRASARRDRGAAATGRSRMRDVDVHVRALQGAEEPQPQRKHHLGTAGRRYVSEVDDGLPTEITEEPRDLRFGRRVVAADEHVVVAGHEAGIDHHVAVHRVQRLHDASARKCTLDLLAEGI